jgi:hypothetical protein
MFFAFPARPCMLVPAWVSEPICDYPVLMDNAGDDHDFVMALLRNFQARPCARAPSGST